MSRGSWLPGTLGFVGAILVALALVDMAKRFFGEGMLDSLCYDRPVVIVILVLGSVLLWLSRRQPR